MFVNTFLYTFLYINVLTCINIFGSILMYYKLTILYMKKIGPVKVFKLNLHQADVDNIKTIKSCLIKLGNSSGNDSTKAIRYALDLTSKHLSNLN